jgi:hypothetical protein
MEAAVVAADQEMALVVFVPSVIVKVEGPLV